jgi:hypothetical protein
MASSSTKINSKPSSLTTKNKSNLVYASNQANKPSLLSNLNNNNNKVVTNISNINNNTNSSSSSSTSSSSSEHPSLTINPFPMVHNINNMTHRTDFLVMLDHDDEIEDNTPLTTEEEFKKLDHFLYIFCLIYHIKIFN